MAYRENLAKEKQAQAAIGNRPQPGGPGDGGEVPPVRGYIFKSSGTSHDAPAAELVQQLAKERSLARVSFNYMMLIALHCFD